jgi:hypothetical protein
MSLNNILNSDLFSELNYIDQLFASYQPPVSQQISGSIQSSTKVNTPVQGIYSIDEQLKVLHLKKKLDQPRKRRYGGPK